MHVAYHNITSPCGLFTSAEQTTFNISNNVVIPLLLSFLTCIVECVCVCRRRGGNSGYRVWLKMCVRWLLHRKVQCEVTLVIELCLFLSMVVWQPFRSCWRYIIACVSEMHVAYHIPPRLVGYLHQRNKQHSTSQTTLWYLLLSFLTCIVECVCVCVGGGGE
jgi:hypothetical protein